MIFGLFEIAFLVAIGWAVVNVARRLREKNDPNRRVGPAPHGHRPAWPDQTRTPLPPAERSSTIDFDARRTEPVAQPPAKVSGPGDREQAMAELRRRYVEDEITVEEYEAELDRLMRGE